MKSLYEGKAKRLYETEQSDQLLTEFRDDSTAFKCEKRSQIRDILTNESSAYTCRHWNVTTGEKMDKNLFRRDLTTVMESYAEVLNRAQDAVNR